MEIVKLEIDCKLKTVNCKFLDMFRSRGFTMMEILVALGIFLLLVIPTSEMLIHSFRYNAIIWEQLKTQNDGRRSIREVVDVVRKAEASSLGAYSIAVASDYDLTIYANVDEDSYREKVRFWLDGTTLKKNVIKPSGNPLGYSGAGVTTELAHDVVNVSKGIPLFVYYDENFTGTQASLSLPIDVTKVRIVKIDLELEKDPTETPVPLRVESMVQVRNLKTN